MDRSVEEAGKARALGRAASRVGKGGISSDDPEAVSKLGTKLSKMEAKRELMKKVNKEFRKGGWAGVECLSEESKRKLEANMVRMPWVKAPFPSYALTNLGANIRRVKERIKELEVKAETPAAASREGRGFVLVEDQAENRIRLVFDEKPDASTRSLLKANGFRWAPSVGAWQRMLNDAGRAAARLVAEMLARS
jgi:hypothetical protein